MESNRGDSHRCYTENIWDKENFFKEYKKKHISKAILEIYHTLHQYMSTKDTEVYFGDITLDGEIINKRNIKILNLDPKSIYESTEIETKNSILITNPTYIEGKTLKDYEDQLWKNTTQCICDAITRYIETLTKVKFTDMYGVTPNNIKIHIKDNNAELIITDISCNIRNFFHSGKNAVALDELCQKNS
ncbi:MAG: hypothetical protein ACD_80C00148G0001 [uncultured bacterium (gcode 4)]|uniref:Uncharacterized protein n=1 Tax=uncultured bacterium (gcode 4) TaxID=1234023 RepID=K1XWM7_9BACT|nr:MAG: hypothetical protein ACD_80C00148G0001 [uncultured bacterium (gcode 4)]